MLDPNQVMFLGTLVNIGLYIYFVGSQRTTARAMIYSIAHPSLSAIVWALALFFNASPWILAGLASAFAITQLIGFGLKRRGWFNESR